VAHKENLVAEKRLQQDIKAIMELQSRIDDLEGRVAEAEKLLVAKGSGRRRTRAGVVAQGDRHAAGHITAMRDDISQLREEVDGLYSSLNIENDFPEIANLGHDFAVQLIRCHDYLRIVRVRAIAQFEEYDQLDRVGGAEKLGELPSWYCCDN
jgi:hypothetical protein